MIETIKATFTQKLEELGIEVEEVKSKRIFKCLLSSGDFSAQFLISDQENNETLQGVCWLEECPKTSDVLRIGEKFYRVYNIQKRIGSPIARFTANLKLGK